MDGIATFSFGNSRLSNRRVTKFKSILGLIVSLVAFLPSVAAATYAANLQANPNPSTGNYTLTWNTYNLSNDGDYFVQQRLSGTSTWSTIFSTNRFTTSYNVVNQPNGTYEHRIWHSYLDCGGGFGGNCDLVNVYSQPMSVSVGDPPATPGAITGPSSDPDGSFTLSWGSASGATSYPVQRRHNSGGWSTVQSSNATSHSTLELADGTWDFRVQACNAFGCSAWTATKTVNVQRPPDPPGAISGPSNDIDGSFTLSWGSVSGATYYAVQRQPSGGSWVPVQSSSSISYPESGLADGTWNFRVRACNALGCSAWSAVKTVTVLRVPGTPGPITGPGSSGSGSFTVSWSAVPSATSYPVQRRFNGQSWDPIQSSSSTSRPESALTDGDWGYRVQACNASGCSAWSAVKTVSVLSASYAANLQAAPNPNTGNYTLTWITYGPSSNGDYHVQQRLSGTSTWSIIFSTNQFTTSHNVVNQPNGTYEHRMWHSYLDCGGGCELVDVYSDPISVTVQDPVPNTPDAPITQLISLDGSYTVPWNAETGATSYKLEEQVDGQGWTEIYSGSATTRSFSNRATATYDYRIKACNSTGCSAPSASSAIEVERISELHSETAISTATAYGDVPLNASVDRRGDAAIIVPLRIPDGVNGLAPRLALTYSSGASPSLNELKRSEGVLGYGWRLGGPPEIRRCRVGIGGDLQYDTTDRLCLNGNAMVKVAGPNPDYWSDGAEYRTEIDSTTKITAHGSGLANRYFTAFLPNGDTVLFGDTADTRVTSPGYSSPYLWSPRLRTDGAGNQMTYVWRKVSSIGTNFLRFINYGNASIEFRYHERCLDQTNCDSETVQNGENVPGVKGRAVVLNRVLTKVDSNIVSDYRLDNNYVGGYLRLEKIQHCGYTEAGALEGCMAPLAFNWQTLAIGDTSGPTVDQLAVNEVTNSFGDSTYFDYTIINGAGGNDPAAGDHPLDLAVPSGFPGYTGTFADTATSTRQRALVSSIRHPDGRGGTTTTAFRYTNFPLYSTKGRGYVGFPSISTEFENKTMFDASSVSNYTGSSRRTYQFRMDFPYIGLESRRIVEVDTNPGSVQSWALVSKRMRAFRDVQLHGNTVWHPYLHTEFIDNRERTATGGGGFGSAQKISYSECWQPLSSGTCPGGVVSVEAPTQLKAVVRTGLYVSGSSNPPTIWGAIDTTTGLVGQTHVEERTEDLSSVTSNWVHGFVERSEVGWGVTSATESVEVSMQRASGLDNKPGVIHWFAGDPVYDRTLVFNYDTYGNVSSTNETGAKMPTITWTYASFAGNKYPQSVTNPLNQLTTHGYDQRAGEVDSITDPNGNVTTTVRDAFGRINEETADDGTKITTTYASCVTGCSMINWAIPRLKVTKTYTHGTTKVAPDEVMYLDTLGSVVLIETGAFSSASGVIRQQRHYDAQGKVVKQSLPYFSVGGTPKFIDVHYDRKDRAVYVSRPDGSNISTTYYADPSTGGHVNVEVEESGTGRTKLSRFNRLGQLVETTDAYGSVDAVMTTYTYTVRGQLETVTVDGTLVADIDYDNAGNREFVWEPNSGTTNFDYYSTGWLELSTDANTDKTFYEYDALGRVRERIDGQTTVGAVTNTWNWDTAANGIGSLGSRNNGAEFSETYTYDTHGRLDTISAAINVAGFTDSGPYVIDYGYDATGRLQSIQYPNNITFTNEYTSTGYLSAIKKGSSTLHQYDGMDAFGNIVDETYGNGLKTARTYDPNTGELTAIQTGTSGLPTSVQDLLFDWRTDGSLLSRTDKRGTATTSDDLIETFIYDDLGRLKTADTLATNRTLSMTYDDYGNLLTKLSDISGDLDVTGYSYPTPANPHRLSTVSIDGISNTLSYDSAGNITQYNAASGDDTFIEYDRASRVTQITVGSSSIDPTPTAQDEFWYGPGGQRYLRKASWMDGSTLKTSWTLYLLGGVFEEVRPEHDGTVDYRQRVLVTDNVQHQFVKYPASSATVVEYLHRDHLGSIVVRTDAAGTATNTVGFDPFGRQRETSWASDISSANLVAVANAEDTFTGRGFTDHEMLNRTGFVHMNGRVYDSRIGRFLQADPIVGQPDNSQNYNRYAYLLNNPLSATDPSGFDCLVCFELSFQFTNGDGGKRSSGKNKSPSIVPPVVADVVEGLWDFVIGDTIDSAVDTYGNVADGDYAEAAVDAGILACEIAKVCKVVAKVVRKFGGRLIDKMKRRFGRTEAPDATSGSFGSRSVGAAERSSEIVLSRAQRRVLGEKLSEVADQTPRELLAGKGGLGRLQRVRGGSDVDSTLADLASRAKTDDVARRTLKELKKQVPNLDL